MRHPADRNGCTLGRSRPRGANFNCRATADYPGTIDALAGQNTSLELAALFL